MAATTPSLQHGFEFEVASASHQCFSIRCCGRATAGGALLVGAASGATHFGEDQRVEFSAGGAEGTLGEALAVGARVVGCHARAAPTCTEASHGADTSAEMSPTRLSPRRPKSAGWQSIFNRPLKKVLKSSLWNKPFCWSFGAVPGSLRVGDARRVTTTTLAPTASVSQCVASAHPAEYSTRWSSPKWVVPLSAPINRAAPTVAWYIRLPACGADSSTSLSVEKYVKETKTENRISSSSYFIYI